MSTQDAIEFGAGSALRFARNRGRSITGEALGAIRYPSPFFDIAHTYLPSSFKSMLRWCRFYFLTNPLINAVCYKMAEYPVTDLIFDTDNEPLKNKWKHVFNEVFKFKKFEVEVGLDYNVYGNAFVSIFFPFHKYLKCKSCKKTERVHKVKYVFREFKFNGTCPFCGHYGPFDVIDHPVRSARDIRLIRWNPEYITLHHNDATGETRYYYMIPPTLANDIRMAKRHVIESVPQTFIEALRTNKAMLFSPDGIYHLKRPTIAQKDKGWGMPMILPVLKDTFYLQILRKAQEAIAIEHIVPLRLLFPNTASASADVYSTVSLTKWRDKMEQEIMRWRVDNNYIPIMPLPVGSQTIGGDGRALMLAQEYRVWAEHIVSGMGAPIEFVFGGLQYSASNVTIRILENHFLDSKTDKLQLAHWLMNSVGAYMDWQTIDLHYRRFKMADDLQRSAFNLQLNQAGKVSDESMLEENDWDSSREQERIASQNQRTLEQQRQQALGQAAIQGEAQMVLQKYQLRAQKAMMLAQQGGQPPMDPQAAQQMQQAGMMSAGQPGVVSPNAAGQMMTAQQGMANQMGMIPPTAAAMPQEGARPAKVGKEQEEAQRATEEAQRQQAQAEQAGGGSPAVTGVPQEAQSPIGYEQVGANASVADIVNKIVGYLDQLPDNEKQAELANLRQSDPQTYSMVISVLNSRAGAHAMSNSMPLPEQRPPRRGPEAAMI